MSSPLSFSSSVKDIHYEISIQLDLDKRTYEGFEIISAKIKDPEILLNCSGVEIDEVLVDNKHAEVIYPSESILRLLNDQRASEKLTIYIKFHGTFNQHLQGLFVIDSENDPIAATHFEPAFCRTMIPCFDQPDMKATFDLTLTIKEDYIALSNMDVKITEALENGYRKIQFNTTPLMSTYLLAFVVGKFNFIESKKARVPLRIYFFGDNAIQVELAMSFAESALDYYETQFKMPYPLAKLDLVVLPEFVKGGMENFGLINFKESYIYADPHTASEDTKENIAVTIFHEIAHQWFGNLVTMTFWDDLWLKEAFSDWMAWHAVNKIYPDWTPWTSFIIYDLQNALNMDSRRSTHPIRPTFSSLDDIEQSYDHITYAKGCAVLKMLTDWVGEETFLSGIQIYLKKFQWSTATSEELWKVIGEVSGVDVTSVMDIWANTEGFPVISIKERDGRLFVEQERFLSLGEVEPHKNYVYPLFVNIRTLDGIKPIFISSRSQKVDLSISKRSFLKLNTDAIGFYRCQYSDDQWKNLSDAGRKGQLSETDRIGLLADCTQLAFAGRSPIVKFFELIEYWMEEESYTVWEELLNDLFDIQDVFLLTDCRSPLETYVKRLLDKKIDDCLEENESDSFDETSFKSTVFTMAYSVKSEKVIRYCFDQFNNALADPGDLPPNKRSSIFRCVASNGDRKEFDKLKEFAHTNSDSAIKEDALSALGKFTQEDILQEVLASCLADIKESDILGPLRCMSMNVAGIPILWKWLQAEWNNLINRVGFGTEMHLDIIKTSLAMFSTQEQLNEVEAFFEGKKEHVLEKTVDACLEKIKLKRSIISRNEKGLGQWLRLQDVVRLEQLSVEQ